MVVDDTQDTAQDRVTIQEAARRLGVKEDAIRKRIQRRSLEHEKTPEGRVYVWVDAAQDTAEDAYRAASQDALLSAKDETISALREQLQAERQAHAEARRIIAGLVERIPAIEAPQEEASPGPGARQAPEAADEQRGRGEASTEPQAAMSRPWWRRVFAR